MYGRGLVNIETDHKPLETIFLKLLASAPTRLQRMILRLQKYSLHVAYKKGKAMHLADTLSRAYLPEVNACDFTRKLEDIDHRTFKWEGRERCQDSKEAFLQVQGSWEVSVSGPTGLAQHTLCWNRYKPCPASHGKAMQDTSTSCWLSATAATFN